MYCLHCLFALYNTLKEACVMDQNKCSTLLLQPTYTTYTVRIGEEMVLLNAQTSECVGLNFVASLLWERFSAGATMADVMEQMQQQYDVDPDRLQSDLQAFLHEMQHKGFLVPVSRPASRETVLSSCYLLPHMLRLLARFNRLTRVPFFEWVEAFWMLCYVQHHLFSRGLASMIDAWNACSVSYTLSHEKRSVEHLARLVQSAARWQRFQAACLHQCLALGLLLRFRGIHAELMIGVTTFPFMAHAWLTNGQEPLWWEAGLGHDRRLERLQSLTVLFSTAPV
jgi:hypothetical protein